jgi:Flp pilus assembly protein TadG
MRRSRRSRSTPGSQSQRGATAVTVGLLLMVIGGFLALVINVGHLMSLRNQLQNRVDAAALAATIDLDGTADGIEKAHLAAQSYALLYQTDKIDVAIDANLANDQDGDIVHGIWDMDEPDKALGFTPATAATDPRDVNAVLVRSGREDWRGNPFAVFFSVFANNQATAEVRASAVAVGGGPCESCAVPIAFPSCLVLNPDGSLNCNATLRLSNDPNDNMGLTSLDPDNPASTAEITKILQGKCVTVDWDHKIRISNGNPLTPLANDFEAFALTYGTKMTAPIIDAPCPPKFNGSYHIHGFATFTFIGVFTHGSNKYIEIQVDCAPDRSDPVPSGCGPTYNKTSPVTWLVQ